MTDEQLRDISPALTGFFLRQFESHFENHDGVRHIQNPIQNPTRCLLSDMERKTAEPMGR